MGSTGRMFFRLVLLALSLSVCETRAQGSGEDWVLLSSSVPALRTGQQTIVISEARHRTRAVILVAKGAQLSLARVVVTYANGQTHFEDRTISLQPDQRSARIDEREDERVVEAVSIAIAHLPAGTAAATLEIWGLRAQPDQSASLPQAKRGSDVLAAQRRGYYETPVYFGTTRTREGQRTKNGRVIVMFNNKLLPVREGPLNFGLAVVTVPYNRPPGSIPRNVTDLIIMRVALRGEDPTRDFTIQSVDVTDRNGFVAGIRRQLREAIRYREQVLVFVHGYNVSFEDALFRSAQIARDIDYDGPVVLFSWPTAGEVLGYGHDIQTSKGSRDGLRELLTAVAGETGTSNINLIAHSMGNEPLIDVLLENSEFARKGAVVPSFKLNELVMAAPDVTRAALERFASRYAGAKGGITLFASSNDRALIASRRLAGGLAKAGEVPREGILVVPKVESIDISAASTALFSVNHSTFADRAHVITDLGLLFDSAQGRKHPPHERFRVYKTQGIQPKQWWQYVPNQ